MLGRIFGLAAACALLALAGCYTADQPLITDAEVATPYEKITLVARGGDDEDEPAVFVRQGLDYEGEGGDAGLTLRFKALAEPGWFIAEMHDDSGIDLELMYALVNFDPDNKVAVTYATMAFGEISAPGLRECGESVCIDDLDAYVAHARERIAAGESPDITYDVTVE